MQLLLRNIVVSIGYVLPLTSQFWITWHAIIIRIKRQKQKQNAGCWVTSTLYEQQSWRLHPLGLPPMPPGAEANRGQVAHP